MENIHVNEYMHNITSGDCKYCKIKIKQLKKKETNADVILEKIIRKVSSEDYLKQICV